MNPRQRSSPVQQRAFTLLELMIVVILIGVMAAMIIPEMKGTYENALLRSTSRRLVSVFSLASSRAITLHQLHQVRLDAGSSRYLIETRNRANRQTEPFRAVEGVPGSAGEIDTRIKVILHHREGSEMKNRSTHATGGSTRDTVAVSATEAITFYPDGTADAGEVLLRDREGFGLALRINPITACIHIVELPRE